MAASKKTAQQQKAAMMALMEANQGQDLVLDAKEEKPTVRHRHNKHADLPTKPASFRLPMDVLEKLDRFVWSETNRSKNGKPQMSRADVVTAALREWLSERL
ncbi:ribbon-helix-helix domain-containing protein [Bifidobacterium olomucense]|uniref:Uncharacterized protein n=1 Tax=Bifidobacterium olomucense TaxID=2675324 RepID=A0A7Y0HY49_9BIFI|nr:ribbon-helix-helix domain-containing protein [Bifidobacterium sp. DSM 109959]NMM99378.1 hypothetical protein [Bifidobacterium sp. DSM 109959]